MLEKLRVVFMGTPDFSVKILDSLVEKTNVVLVVTQPDKVQGRHNILVYPRIKEAAIRQHIEVFQPINIKNDYDSILVLNPDIIITCAYGQILPSAILNFPKYGCINVHASLLPKLRGGAPIHHAIIDGYTETGVTIMYMDEGMDTGDIITYQKTKIEEDDTYRSLHDRLSRMGRDLLIETLPSIINGDVKRIKQDSREATYGFNIKKRDALIDFRKNLNDIYNQIRGLNPTPGAYFMMKDTIVKVYGAMKVYDDTYQHKTNGEIVKLDEQGIYIKVKDGLIKITELKVAGKVKMNVTSFLNGNRGQLLGLILNEGVKYER